MYSTHKPQATCRTRKARLGAVLAPLLLVVGCQTNAGTGALAGGGIGALAGGVIGAATGHAGAGALIGGAAGATLGGVAGASEDHRERQIVRANAERRAVGLQDVVSLTKSGTSDQIIINQINTSGSIYRLSGAEIQWLHDSGVHDCVIETMQATASRPPLVYDRPEVVYVAPPPPPVGFGVVIRGGR